jgi:hypothetical protein
MDEPLDRGRRQDLPLEVRFPPFSVGESWVRLVRFQEFGRAQPKTGKGAERKGKPGRK